MNELVQYYILFAILVGLIKTISYYRSHIRYETQNASRKQIRDAIILTLVISTIFAPLVIVDLIIDTFNRKGNTYE